MQMHPLFFRLFLFGNHARNHIDQRPCQGQHHGYGHRIEERVEHGQLCLGGMGEQVLEHPTEPSGFRCEVDNPARDQEQDDAETVEQKMNQRGPAGVDAAGDSGKNGYHAGTDIGTHRQENALVQRNQSGHHHGERDGGHDGWALDDGGEDGAREHQQNGVTDGRQEVLYGILCGEGIHRSAHQR